MSCVLPFMKRPQPPTTEKRTPGTKRRVLLISLLLAVVTFIVFFQVIQSEFVNFDDDVNITENQIIRNGLTAKGIVWSFTTVHAGFWHPLTWLSHLIVVQLFGLNPGWHHLVNLILHLANTILLFIVFNRMTQACWPSAFVAALFALHPLHVESVAWVTERKDVLSTFFWILTIHQYISYVTRPGLKEYLTVFFCFTLGLMAKPMLVTLPFALLLLDYWPLCRLEQKRPSPEVKHPPQKKGKKEPATVQTQGQPTVLQWSQIRPLLLEKIPFFGLTLLFCIVSYLAQSYWGALSSFESLSLSARLANALISYLEYIIRMVWPVNLAVLYPHPGSWPTWQVLVSVALLIFFTILAFLTRKRHPYGIVGWFWYLGTLVPVIGIVQVGGHAMADRYSYVPLIGLFMIISWGMVELLKTWSYRKQILAALSGLSLLILSLLTWRQVGYWQGNLSLYNHTLEVATKRSFSLKNRDRDDPKDLAIITPSVKNNPGMALIYNNRGVTYRERENYQQAIKDYDKAIDLDPKFVKTYYNRAITYDILGNYQQALKDYDKAIELDPKEAKSYNNRGIVYGRLGNLPQAIKDFGKALELDPQYAAAYMNRGIAYHKLGNLPQALSDLKSAARLGDKAAQDLLKNKGLGW